MRGSGAVVLDLAEDMPLPAQRYLPGISERPDEGAFDEIIARVPEVTCDADSAANQTWRYGLRLFNAGFYWEAHEVLEPVWKNAAPNSRERHIVQAVIQLANGCLKRDMRRANASLRLAALAAQCVDRAFPERVDRLMGLEAREVADAAEKLASGVRDIRLVDLYAL